MACEPKYQKYGGVIIRPVRPDLVQFDNVKERLDQLSVTRTLEQTYIHYDNIIIPANNKGKKVANGQAYFESGSNEGEDHKDLLVKFYRKVKKAPVKELYGSDIKMSLTAGHDFLDLNKLAMESCLKYDTQTKKVPGIHESYTYLGHKDTGACLHREDVDMGSANVMLWAEEGAVKTWFFVGCADYFNCQLRLTDIAMKTSTTIKDPNFFTNSYCCEAFYRNKGLYVTLDTFEEWATKSVVIAKKKLDPIDIFIGHQIPGDLVLTFPRAWHQVYNSGELYFSETKY